MGKMLRKLMPNAENRKEQNELYLKFIRFQKFLENIRNVDRIVEDARDKLNEEYIFDRHYILSLVDDVLEESALMALNASVLSPASGSQIFTQLDAQKQFVQEAFLNPDSIRTDQFSLPASCLDADPETQWLHAALNWLTGPLPQNRVALMDFFRCVIDDVMEHDGRETWIERIGRAAVYLSLKKRTALKTFNFGITSILQGEQAVPAENINCSPFGLLAMGIMNDVRAGSAPSEEGENGDWMLYNEEEMSLHINRNDTTLHLETKLHGDIATDFVFLYSRNSFDLESLCLRDARIEKTGTGIMAWLYDVPTMQLEKQLIQLGSAFFCTP